MEENSISKFRIILKQEDPSTDIENIKGTLTFQKTSIQFIPQTLDPTLERTYALGDLTNAVVVTTREWFKKKELLLLEFTKKQVSVSVYFEPIDVSPDFLLQEILRIREKLAKGPLSSVVGSWIEKLGVESQKIVREVGAIIQSSSQEITQALDQTKQFIREAIETSDMLEPIDIDINDRKKTINLDVNDIDEILKRSLASNKIEAMVSSLIAKGLISAKDQNFQEALDALRIAREAARTENMNEYTEIADD
ncbi:MAG: hypothetical protein JSV04_00515, partial [Candidatus Heimdallarchaeota archaeon]